MAIVVLLDQRNSSTGPDLVEATSAALNEQFADALALTFVRTAGDEMEGVLSDSTALIEIVADVLDRHAWWIGLGIGAISHVGETARASTGSAFNAAREAIDAAKRDRGAPGPAVRGSPHELSESLQAALAGWAFIRSKRTPRQREVLAIASAADTQRTAGERLGMTQQAVSDALAAAGDDAERQRRRLIERIAGQASQV